MSTRHPDIFEALAEPFAAEEVKTRPQGGRKLPYITARTAMNRLDAVLGPENWWDRYVPGEKSVLCELTIRLPDGTTLTKCDAGGYAGMADSGDDDKSGYSDAFKRAAVKFGVARYLYNDGVPDFNVGRASTADVKRFEARVNKYCEAANAKWLDRHMKDGGEIPEWVKDLISPYQLVNHMLKAAGVELPEGGKFNERMRAAASLWLADEKGTLDGWKTYIVSLKEKAEAKAASTNGREPGSDDQIGD